MDERVIHINWDEKACVWVATSDNISGLVLESGSLDALMEKCKTASVELIEMNEPEHDEVVKLRFISELTQEVNIKSVDNVLQIIESMNSEDRLIVLALIKDKYYRVDRLSRDIFVVDEGLYILE